MLEELIEKYGENLLKADGYDEAIIGVDSKTGRLIYSINKCIDILCKEMDHDEAVEYFYFNVEGAYVGEQTPIWCDDYV